MSSLAGVGIASVAVSVATSFASLAGVSIASSAGPADAKKAFKTETARGRHPLAPRTASSTARVPPVFRSGRAASGRAALASAYASRRFGGGQSGSAPFSGESRVVRNRSACAAASAYRARSSSVHVCSDLRSEKGTASTSTSSSSLVNVCAFITSRAFLCAVSNASVPSARISSGCQSILAASRSRPSPWSSVRTSVMSNLRMKSSATRTTASRAASNF